MLYKQALKRVIDFVLASIGFTLLFPIFFLITLALTIANQGRPFFFQRRPGKGNRIFTIVKFKTMNDRQDALGNLLPDADRLTPIGQFVRKTSLDEIPQLLNVIKGDMSLVGPRPLLVEYLPLYTQEQARRHEVRPGITGWAQINGRNAISWEEKFTYDVWYVDHLSFSLDVKILWRTVAKVFCAKGITSVNSATVEKFQGSGE